MAGAAAEAGAAEEAAEGLNACADRDSLHRSMRALRLSVGRLALISVGPVATLACIADKLILRMVFLGSRHATCSRQRTSPGPQKAANQGITTDRFRRQACQTLLFASAADDQALECRRGGQSDPRQSYHFVAIEMGERNGFALLLLQVGPFRCAKEAGGRSSRRFRQMEGHRNRPEVQGGQPAQ
jgi:hypothetical protein